MADIVDIARSITSRGFNCISCKAFRSFSLLHQPDPTMLGPTCSHPPIP